MDLRVRSQRSHDQSGIKHYYLIFDLCKLKGRKADPAGMQPWDFISTKCYPRLSSHNCEQPVPV